MSGFWAHPTKAVAVKVPLLSHGYYPRIDHTPDVVARHSILKPVIIPSVATMRENGYDVERVAFITEILVPARHEKNWNFFRTDFPAILKSLARRERITFVIPAFDIPSAKMKRKNTLQFLRQSFTPLLMKSRHYTTGRMGVYVVPHSPEVLAGLRRSLHLESAENLEEMNKHAVKANKPRRSRRARPVHGYADILRRKQARQNAEDIAASILDTLENDLSTKVTPVVSRQLHLDREQTHVVDSILSSKEAQGALYQEYEESRHNYRKAAKDWVKEWFLPEVRDRLGEQVKGLASQAITMAISAAISLIFMYTLQKAVPKKWRDKMQVVTDPPVGTAGFTRVQFGGEDDSLSSAEKDRLKFYDTMYGGMA